MGWSMGWFKCLIYKDKVPKWGEWGGGRGYPYISHQAPLYKIIIKKVEKKKKATPHPNHPICKNKPPK